MLKLYDYKTTFTAAVTIALTGCYSFNNNVVFVHAARAYPLGCLQKPASYSDYDDCTFPLPGVKIRDAQDFALVRRLGTGKFSDVFEAIDEQLEENNGEVHNNNIPYNNEDIVSYYNDKSNAIEPHVEVVIKCLKPVSERKIRRELLILQHVSKLPNLARLRGLVLPPKRQEQHEHFPTVPQMPSLIMDHAGPQAQWFCHNGGDTPLSDYEIRYYLYHLLVALDGMHSMGIMHRDVKPRNVLINRKNKNSVNAAVATAVAMTNSESSDFSSIASPSFNPLMLIDMGLADFYKPRQRYNVRVASRHYKSPELLLGQELYDYSIDMWGVGCILAGLLLRREPMWRGTDNVDQLGQILSCLGTKDCLKYIQKENLNCSQDVQKEIAKYHQYGQQEQDSNTQRLSLLTPSKQQHPQYHARQPWLNFLADGAPVPPRDGLDLLDQLLQYDPDYRLTAKQAMAHSFFDNVRQTVDSEILLQQQRMAQEQNKQKHPQHTSFQFQTQQQQSTQPQAQPQIPFAYEESPAQRQPLHTDLILTASA